MSNEKSSFDYMWDLLNPPREFHNMRGKCVGVFLPERFFDVWLAIDFCRKPLKVVEGAYVVKPSSVVFVVVSQEDSIKMSNSCA